MLCVCGVVVRRSSERAKATANPGRETAKGIDAEKVAWGGCRGMRQRRGHGATEEISLLRPHAAARESGNGELRSRAVQSTNTGAVGQKAGVVKRRDVRRYTRQEQSLGADEGRSFSQAGCLRRTTCPGVESPRYLPLATDNHSAAPTCRREHAAAPEREGATAQLAGRSRELSICSTNFGVLWHDSSSQPLCHRRSYNRGPR